MGLIGRRYTAAMPSRPVLIGRGLVPHPHTNKNRVCKAQVTEHVSRPLPNTKQPGVHTTRYANNPEPTHTASTPTQRRPPWVTRVTAAIATGKHPDPSRTRKLSLPAPMVLPPRGGGRVGRRRTSFPTEATPRGGLCCVGGPDWLPRHPQHHSDDPEKVTTRGRPATRPASRPWIRQ